MPRHLTNAQLNEYVGLRQGRLTIVEYAGRMGSENRHHYKCLCDCGNTFFVNRSNIQNKTTRSCGCFQKDQTIKLSQEEIEGLAGERFGRLTVLSYAGRVDGLTTYKCRCDCGAEGQWPRKQLVSGKTQSCGCLQKDRASAAHKTHGMTKTRTYGIWQNAIRRCHDPKAISYSDYGGKGITVCERWRTSFQNFFEDMGECPPGLTIDRIDNSRGYEPGNCHWVSMKEQQNNRTNNIRLEFMEQSKTITEWAELLGIDRRFLDGRYRSRGCSTVLWVLLSEKPNPNPRALRFEQDYTHLLLPFIFS